MDEDDQTVTVSKVTARELRKERRVSGEERDTEVRINYRDPRHNCARDDSIYKSQSSTATRMGQSFVRGGGTHPVDVDGEYDEYDARNAPALDAPRRVTVTQNKIKSDFLQLLNSAERSKLVGIQTTKPEIVFLNLVSGFIPQTPESLYQVVGNALQETAINFVRNVKAWTTKYRTKKVRKFSEVAIVEASDEAKLFRCVNILMDFIDTIASLNKKRTLEIFRNKTLRVGDTVLMANVYQQMLLMAKLGTLYLYNNLKQTLKKHSYQKMYGVLHLICTFSQNDHDSAEIMALLIDIICSGEFVNSVTSLPGVVRVFGEGVKTEIANEIRAFLTDLVGEENIKPFFACNSLSDVCDNALAALGNEEIKTYTQFDSVIISPMALALSDVSEENPTMLQELYQHLKDALNAATNFDIVINNDVVAATDAAFCRVAGCAPSCRNRVTKTMLMRTEATRTSFAELTALLLKQTKAAKSYHQQEVLKQMSERINSLIVIFSTRLRWDHNNNTLLL